MTTSILTQSEAFHLHQSGQLEQALEAYIPLLNKLSGDELANCHELIAIAYGQLGQFSESLTHFQAGLKLTPHSLSLQSNLATCYKRLGQTKRAIKQYQDILKHHPAQCVTLNNLATIYIKEQAYDQAAMLLLKALSLQPNYADAYFNLSLCNLPLYQKRYCALLIKAVSLNHHRAPQALALYYEQNNELDKAKQYYQKSLSIIKDHALSHHGLARVLLALGEDEKAIEHFISAQKIDPTIPHLMENIATYYHVKGMHVNAIEYWSKAPRTAENTLDIQYNIGVSYHYANRHQEALEYFMSILDKDPNHRNAHMNIAAIALQNNHPKQAISHYEQALKQDPDNPEIGFILSALKQNTASIDEAPSAYVANLFDQYARHYNTHLMDMLRYQLPDKITSIIHEQFKPLNNLRILDLGCGTGLLAKSLKPFANHLVGVDLSDNMLLQAKALNLYDELHQQDILNFLDTETHYDLMIAAELFPYIGDPKALLTKIANRLSKKGICVLSIEYSDNKQLYTLTENARFKHCPNAIQSILTKLGFQVISQEKTTLRQHQNKPVIGVLFTIQLLQ